MRHIHGDFMFSAADQKGLITGGMHTKEGLSFLKEMRPDLAANIGVNRLPNGVAIAEIPEGAFLHVDLISRSNKVTRMVNGKPSNFIRKTLFPETWSTEDITRAIHQTVREAKNIRPQGNTRIITGKVNGIDLEVVVIEGRIETAYPIY